MDKNNGPNNDKDDDDDKDNDNDDDDDKDDDVNDDDKDENVDDDVDDDDDDDDDDEYHDSYDVIMRDPVQIEQDISDVPSLKHPSEYSTETEDNKRRNKILKMQKLVSPEQTWPSIYVVLILTSLTQVQTLSA